MMNGIDSTIFMAKRMELQWLSPRRSPNPVLAALLQLERMMVVLILSVSIFGNVWKIS
jgi:hypothetical protein